MEIWGWNWEWRDGNGGKTRTREEGWRVSLKSKSENLCSQWSLSAKQLMPDQWGISKSHFEPLKSLRTSPRTNWSSLRNAVLSCSDTVIWRVRWQGMKNSNFIQAKMKTQEWLKEYGMQGRQHRLQNSSQRGKKTQLRWHLKSQNRLDLQNQTLKFSRMCLVCVKPSTFLHRYNNNNLCEFWEKYSEHMNVIPSLQAKPGA